MKPFPLSTLWILLVGMVLSGCSGGSSRSDNSGLNGLAITAILDRQSVQGVLDSLSASVTIINQGTEVPDAAVTLTVPGVPGIALAGDGRGIYDDKNSGSWTYSPGQVYIFEVAWGGSRYSASVTAPGGIMIPGHVSDLPVTWAYPGNLNVAVITKQNSELVYRFLTNLTSPWNPPADDISALGSYQIEVSCERSVLGAFSGGASSACLVIAEDEDTEFLSNP
jgi:hypothetical protein